MRARGRTPTDGCVQFGWEVEEKCYELLHDKNSNWDWSHFSELCLTVCLIILYLYPSVITSLALEYKMKFIEVVECFTFLWGVPLSSEALKTGVTSTRSTRIPLLDKRSERCDLKKKKMWSIPSVVWKYQKWLFWRCRLPQISGIINFLACENVKSIVQK